MYNNLLKSKAFIFSFIVYLSLFLLTCKNGFFWDTTHLASKQAWWFYEHNFKHFFIPSSFDSGHPPFFAMLLALYWHLLGVSLPVSHLMMLPFILLLIIQVIIISRYYFGEKYLYPSAIILLNPIVLSQCTLVSPDIVLLSFFYLTLNSILKKKYILVILGGCILCAVSMRGMVTAGTLYLFAVISNRLSLKDMIRWSLLFFPGFILAAAFLLLHYINTGWIGHHPDSPWSSSFEYVGIKGFFRNIIVFAWRMVDMGMLIMWGLVCFVIVKAKKTFSLNKKTSELLILAFLIFILTIMPQFFYAHLLMHRYLLPFIGISSLLFFSCCTLYLPLKIAKKFSLLAIIGLLSGNLWIYPDNIAKGWDATLAHLPYYKLRHDALNYIRQHQIPLNQVSAAFPYDMESKYIDLRNDTSTFSVLPPEEAPYTLYSNIANQYSDDQLLLLKTKFIPVYTFGGWPVRFVLYKNPEIR
ncbi:MAG: hypothetical protein IT249_09280 [Chitinophagaceae bacterium]|nr:hypothetical protein [Chitinophagaceae bacterium]